MNTLLNKRGRIKVAGDILFKNQEEEILKALFSNFFPIAIEVDHSFGWNGSIVYYGNSNQFREIEVGEVVPLYDAKITRNEDGILLCSFTECK